MYSAAGAQAEQRALKHSVGVGGFFRNILHDIPMLDDLAVFQLEDIDDGPAAASFLAHAVNVQDDVIAIGEYAFDLAVGVRKFLAQKTQKRLETFGPVRRGRIVLDIARADKFHRRVK